MHANLVRPPSLNLDFQQSEVAVAGLMSLQHSIMGNGIASSGAARCHPGASLLVAADRGIQRASIELHRPMHQRNVSLMYLAAREHLSQPGVRAVVLCNDNQAAGLFVQPMHDAGP